MSEPEVLAFRAAYPKLTESLTHPEVLAGRLWSAGFINLQERRKAEHQVTDPYTRAVALLNAVSDKIGLAPKEKFREFVDILKSDYSLVPMARLLDPGTRIPSLASHTTNSTAQNGFKESFSEEELKVWLKKIGVPAKDVELLIDEGFGSGPGFMEFTEEDVDDMKFTRGGRKILKKNLISGPVPMDTIPPSNVMAPIPRPSGAAGGPPPPNLPYTPPPEPNTPDSLAEEIGLEPYVLDNEFPDSNYSVVLAFAKLVPDWPDLATSLGLSPQDKRAIETNLNLSYMMKVTEVFKKWKSRYGFKARYRMLIEAALRVDENLAMSMCRLVQKATYGSSARPAQNGRASSPPISPDKMVNMPISINTLIEALRPLHLSRSNNGMLARALKVPDYKISEFEANNPHDIAQVRTEILKDWLRNQPRKWSSISNAMVVMGDRNLARKIKAYQVPEDEDDY